MEKKEWIEPELIVLVRSKPEEAVLGNCKGVLVEIGPVLYVSSCAMYFSEQSCVQCNAQAPS